MAQELLSTVDKGSWAKMSCDPSMQCQGTYGLQVVKLQLLGHLKNQLTLNSDIKSNQYLLHLLAHMYAIAITITITYNAEYPNLRDHQMGDGESPCQLLDWSIN